MRYFSFDAKTREVQSGNSGPPESLLQNLQPGFRVGDAGECYPDGALKNYECIPDDGQSTELSVVKGILRRKPKVQWDLEAEARNEALRKGMQRCHSLDRTDIDRIEVYLLIPAYFVWLSKEPHNYSVSINSVPLTVSVTRVDKIKDHIVVGGGIQNLDLRQSLIKFTLTGKEGFIVTVVDSFLKESGKDFQIFVSELLKTECLKFSVLVANQLIDCYRVAYDDPRARPIGFADAFSCNILVILQDGYTCHYQTENPLDMETQLSQAKGERKDELTQAERAM